MAPVCTQHDGNRQGKARSQCQPDPPGHSLVAPASILDAGAHRCTCEQTPASLSPTTLCNPEPEYQQHQSLDHKAKEEAQKRTVRPGCKAEGEEEEEEEGGEGSGERQAHIQDKQVCVGGCLHPCQPSTQGRPDNSQHSRVRVPRKHHSQNGFR